MSKWNADLMFREDSDVCCVLHLVGWGERGPSFNVGSYTGNEEDHADDLEEVKNHLRICVKGQNAKYSTYSADSMMAKRVLKSIWLVVSPSVLLRLTSKRFKKHWSTSLDPKLKSSLTKKHKNSECPSLH